MTITHATPTTSTAGTGAAPSAGSTIVLGCQAAASQLRWEYTVIYRRYQRLHGTHANNLDADQTACEHLRNLIPIVLARHLPGIRLTQWDDPHPTVIDSTWQHGETVIEIFWNYSTDWTIGDPTALTIQPAPATRSKAA